MSLMKRAWKRLYAVVVMPDYVMGLEPVPARTSKRSLPGEPIKARYSKAGTVPR